MFQAQIEPYTTSEAALSTELLGRLRPGMLCLADRGFYSFAAWQKACLRTNPQRPACVRAVDRADPARVRTQRRVQCIHRGFVDVCQ